MLHNPYSQHYQQIDNPPTPFSSDIPNGLVPGKQIFISATFNPNADQVKIDLGTRNGQIAFHINPRFGQGCIVRNSQLNGWGAEEKSGSFPFQKGRAFEIVILVEDDKYKVAINGHHSFDYRHRCPYQDVSRLSIYGDVRIGRIVYSGGAHSRPNETFNPAIPFSIPVLHGLTPGRMLQIHGQVPPNAAKFALNLQNGPGTYPNDILFHFNPRYNDGAPYVCKNNRRGGAWGAEERDSSNPIARGSNFEILVLAEPSEIKVAVNGQHFTSFRTRNDLNDGNHLNVEGDVIITSIRQF